MSSPRQRRAAIYGRVSTKKEEQARALEGHIARLRTYVEARAFTLAGAHVFADRASGKDDRRPGYQALRAAARAREVDVIVTTKLDRLARSVRELVGLAGELEALGVDLVVTDQAIDTTTPAGRLLFHVIGAVAEFERDLIRDRVNRGLDRARERGKRLGRPAKWIPLDEVRALQAKGVGLRALGKRFQTSAAALSRRLRSDGVPKSPYAGPARNPQK